LVINQIISKIHNGPGFAWRSGVGPDEFRVRLKPIPIDTTMNIRTATLNPWAPLTGFRDLHREISRLFDAAPISGRPTQYPWVNISGDTNTVVITAEIPGADPAAIEVHLEKDQLTIRGTVKPSAPEAEGVTTLRRERPTGDFSRAFKLPFEVEEAAITARYDKGVLEVTLPRAEKSKPRTIPVIAG
jgi:HSP20 family protein